MPVEGGRADLDRRRTGLLGVRAAGRPVLDQLPVGLMVPLVGTGALAFSGTATVNSATTMLATPDVPLVGVR